MAVAGHHYMAKRRSFREFLVNFANEEELHYLLAEKDLKNLGTTPLPINFDTELWWSYFNSIIHERPFVRVGGTCILENIAGKSGAVIADLLGEASYLTPKYTTFVVVHQHEELPHGDEILEAVANARLDETMQSDLLEGAKKALTLYLRMFNWAMLPDNG